MSDDELVDVGLMDTYRLRQLAVGAALAAVLLSGCQPVSAPSMDPTATVQASVACTQGCLDSLVPRETADVPPSGGQPESTPSLDATATAQVSFASAQSCLDSFMPRETSEEEVIACLGRPQEVWISDRTRTLWYDPPRGRVYARDGIVVRVTVLPQLLGAIVDSHGAPSQVVTLEQTGHYAAAITYLLYPAKGLAFGIPGACGSFSRDQVAGGTRLAPQDFPDYVHSRGLDGSSRYVTVTMAEWPGLSGEPAGDNQCPQPPVTPGWIE